MNNMQRFKLGFTKRKEIMRTKSGKNQINHFKDIVNLENQEILIPNQKQDTNTYVFSCQQRQSLEGKSQETISKNLGRLSNHNSSENNITREQWETLKKAFDVKKVEGDNLQRKNKLLEIQLINCNKEHYQKQIQRLKSNLERCQEDYQDIKHNHFIAENQRKELQASFKIKNQEIKSLNKAIQKEKITSAEFKSKLNQKEKFYAKLVSDIEVSNLNISKNYEDLTQKYQKLQNNTKLQGIDSNSLNQQLQICSKRLKESEDKMLILKKHYEKIILEKNEKIIENESILKRNSNQFKEQRSRFSNEVELLKKERRSEALMTENIAKNISVSNQIMAMELEVVRVNQNNNNLILSIEQKNHQILLLEQRLFTFYSPEQYNLLEQRFKQAEHNKIQQEKCYESKILEIKKQNESLKLSSIQFSTISQSSCPNASNFHDILKRISRQNESMKDELEKRTDEIIKLREEVVDLKLKQGAFTNDINILSKNMKALEKNSKISLEVELQKLKNEKDSLNRKLETTNSRLESKIKECKQKDDFIKSTIIGRSKPEDVPIIIAEMERIFLMREKMQVIANHKE